MFGFVDLLGGRVRARRKWLAKRLTTDDTLDELHAFAARIGLRREWFQGTTFPHYDLTAAKRDEAMVAGAVFVTARKQAIARRAARTV
jgi:hypothetical protein